MGIFIGKVRCLLPTSRLPHFATRWRNLVSYHAAYLLMEVSILLKKVTKCANKLLGPNFKKKKKIA